MVGQISLSEPFDGLLMVSRLEGGVPLLFQFVSLESQAASNKERFLVWDECVWATNAPLY